MSYANMPVRPVGYIVPASEWSQIGDNFRAGVPDIFTTAGDMVYATAADIADRLGLGAAGTLLRAGASAPGWATLLTALGFQYQFAAANVTTTSNGTWVALAGGPAVTVTIGPNGLIFVIGKFQLRNNVIGNSSLVTVHDGTSNKDNYCYAASHAAHANHSESIPLIGVIPGYTPGTSRTLTARYMTDSGGQAEAKERFLAAISL